MIRLAFAALLVATPLAAQDVALTKRVTTLETQMRGVQRKVFPGGDPRYFAPEFNDAAPPPAAAPEGSPATAPLADLAARVEALEAQQRTLTGAVEEAQFKLRQLDEAFAKYRGDTDFRLGAVEHPAPPPVAVPVEAPPPPAPKPVKAAPPSVEDQWRAAYARFSAKDYAGAESAMTDFLAANPKAARASAAQYWLGRSYMADEQYAPAAKAFLDGYKKYPNGERTADSLIWLGNALTALKKPEEACKALNELAAAKGDKLGPVQKAAAAKARKDAKCDG